MEDKIVAKDKIITRARGTKIECWGGFIGRWRALEVEVRSLRRFPSAAFCQELDYRSLEATKQLHLMRRGSSAQQPKGSLLLLLFASYVSSRGDRSPLAVILSPSASRVHWPCPNPAWLSSTASASWCRGQRSEVGWEECRILQRASLGLTQGCWGSKESGRFEENRWSHRSRNQEPVGVYDLSFR